MSIETYTGKKVTFKNNSDLRKKKKLIKGRVENKTNLFAPYMRDPVCHHEPESPSLTKTSV